MTIVDNPVDEDTEVLEAIPASTEPSGGPDPANLLEARDIEAGYGPIQVLFGASVHVRPSEQVALLGTNGAGKSTLLRVISGLMHPTKGRVFFKGEDVSGASPLRLVEMGLVYIAGGRATFPSLTVVENLRLSAYPVRRNKAEVANRIDEALTLFPRLRERAEQKAGNLSGGEQQMLAIGRALVSKPDLLMIDELSLGLAPIMLRELQGMIRTLADQGMSMLVVEQSLDMAAKITQHAFFMEKGEVRFDGPMNDLVNRGDLVRSVFFGGGHGTPEPGEPAEAVEPAKAAKRAPRRTPRRPRKSTD